MSTDQEKIRQYYQQIIEASPSGMILVDQEGKIVLVNQTALAMFGHSREELISRTIECLVPPQSVMQHAFLRAQYHASPQVRKMGTGRDLTGLRKDGSIFPLEIGLNPLELEGRTYVMASVVDITARRQSEEELAQYRTRLEEFVQEKTADSISTREFLNRIINNIASPIFVKNKNHRWILLNDAFCSFMGHKREDLIGKSDIDFFPKEEAEVFWQKDQLVYDSGQININEEKFTDAHGVQHTILTKKVIFIQDNGEKVLVGIINDITDLKKNETRILQLNGELQGFNTKLKDAYDQLKEAQDKLLRSERLAALGEMAAMIGHELRNSLGVIRNSVYYLKLKLPEYVQEPNILKYLDILEEEVRISDGVISDILTYNRIKTPFLKKENINAVILGELEKINFPKGVSKVLALDKSLPEIEVDADQLRQVFANIAANALDAMPDGGELRVKTFLQGPWVVAVFTDTGTGIAQENLAKVFNPGFTTKRHGSGLGLAICAGILAMHNGKIDADSQVREGTRISIYLPRLSTERKPDEVKD